MSRTDKNRGAAMVIVLCVIVVFLALSTTIVLAGSVALSTARNNTIYERGKVQAASLSEVFVKDMKRDISQDTSTLVRYVRDQICKDGWIAYDESKERDEQAAGAVKTFTMDTTGEDGTAETHQILIEMYWTCDPDDSVSGNPLSGVDEKNYSDKNVCLFIDVISTLNDMEYHVKRKFSLTSTNAPSSNVEYPYLWNWEVEERNNPGRDKKPEEGGGG